MIIAGSRYQHSESRQLRVVARDKIEMRREVTDDPAFRETTYFSSLKKPDSSRSGRNEIFLLKIFHVTGQTRTGLILALLGKPVC